MSLKEISDLNPTTTLDADDFFHVKQGTEDFKIKIGVLFEDHLAQVNPHNIGKSHVGLPNVSNDQQLIQANNLTDLLDISVARAKLDVDSSSEVDAKVAAHANLTNNPHSVTKAQVGLGSCNNFASSTNARDTSTTKHATISAVADLAAEFDATVEQRIQTGMIMMWSPLAGAVPSGYALCNGQNGTPDLRNRFVRGSDLNNDGKTGGADSVNHGHTISINNHTLTLSQIPAHSHPLAASYKGSYWGGDGEGRNHTTYFDGGASSTSNAGGSGGHAHGANLGNATIATIPKYYALAFIMKL